MEFDEIWFLGNMRRQDMTYNLFRLIILAGFQIFFVVLFLKVLINHKHYGRIKFSLVSDNPDDRFNRDFFQEQVKNKSFINFTLSGDELLDNIAMDQTDSATQKLNLTNDTVHIIKVHFTYNSTYSQFVKLVDIARVEMSYRYVYLDDDFYIFGNPKE